MGEPLVAHLHQCGMPYRSPQQRLIKLRLRRQHPKGRLQYDYQNKLEQKKGTKTMTEKTKNPVSEMLDQGLKNYEQALRTGLKLQAEAGQCWTKLLGQAASPQDLQKQITLLASDVIPATQKSMESCLELLEQNSRASVDLLKRGMEAAQTTSYADAQGKVVEFCESSLKSLKTNAQAIVDINTKAIESWIAFVKKATTEVHEPKAGKA
jgi:polyhydroxyalkanoate synthesis regulator protein